MMRSSLRSISSISVGLESKERPKNGIFGILPARKMEREPKKKKRKMGVGEGCHCGYSSPSPLFNSLRLPPCNSLLPNRTGTLATQARWAPGPR